MKVLFAGGGTAGHINPALAIAGYLREKQPNAEILFIGNRGGMEEKLVPKAGFNMKNHCDFRVSTENDAQSRGT